MKKMWEDVINVLHVMLGIAAYIFMWLLNAFLCSLPILIVLKIIGVI